MRKLLIVLLLLIGGVVALGFYRGWFSSAMIDNAETGRQGILFEIDQAKITLDIEKAKQTISGAGTQPENSPQEQKP
jgi:hypothetical protein